MKQKIVIVCIIMALALYFTFPKQEEPTYTYQTAVDVEPIEVTVNGAVNMPDTYYVFGEVTVYDLINMAGGLRDDADTSTISYAKLINQNTTLSIQSLSDQSEEVVQKINVNDASFAELLDVPYVSESMAAYLIMYREEHGDFQSLDTLINVKYIGAATLEKIKPYLALS